MSNIEETGNLSKISRKAKLLLPHEQCQLHDGDFAKRLFSNRDDVMQNLCNKCKDKDGTTQQMLQL